jgi:hypothetical protein
VHILELTVPQYHCFQFSTLSVISIMSQQSVCLDTELKQTDTAARRDGERLAQLGHVQELRREFSVWSLAGLCLCLMATWEALSTVVAQALIAGGAPCLFYN